MASRNNNDTITLLGNYSIRGSALQLLIIFLAEHTATNRMTIEISVEKVLSLRQMQGTSYARKQIREDMASLDEIQFSYRHSRLGIINARIGTGHATVHKGVIYFTFDGSFRPLIPPRQFMPLPDSVLVTQKNENLAARLLLTWRICQHKRMNLDRDNADRIPVRSLLECCPAIPAYRDLPYRQVNQKIIEPFELALDRCQAYLDWEYEGTAPANYQELLDSHVRITWKLDPYEGRQAFIHRKAKRRKV